MPLDQDKKILEQAMMIVVAAKNNIDAYSKETQSVIHQFNQILESSKTQSEQMIRESHQSLSKTMKDSVVAAIDESTQELEEKLKRTTNVLLNAVDDFHAHKKTIVNQAKWFSWKSLMVFVAGIAMVLAGTYKFSSDSFKKHQLLTEKNAQLTRQIANKNALLETRVFSCGGVACLKIDKSTKAWSDGAHDYMQINND